MILPCLLARTSFPGKAKFSLIWASVVVLLPSEVLQVLPPFLHYFQHCLPFSRILLNSVLNVNLFPGQSSRILHLSPTKQFKTEKSHKFVLYKKSHSLIVPWQCVVWHGAQSKVLCAENQDCRGPRDAFCQQHLGLAMCLLKNWLLTIAQSEAFSRWPHFLSGNTTRGHDLQFTNLAWTQRVVISSLSKK